MEIKFDGDKILELIGETSILVEDGQIREGKAGRSGFVYVRGNGKVDVYVKIVDKDGKEIKGYDSFYAVEVK